MSARSLGTLVLLFSLPASSFAGFVGIDVLSQQHRIWGEVYGCEDIHSYVDFSSTPGSLEHAYSGDEDSCHGYPRWAGAESHANDFSVSTVAWGDGTAHSSATYIFRSAEDTLRFDVHAEALIGDPITRGEFRFSLVDLGTGNGVLSFESPYCGWETNYYVDCLEQGSIYFDSRFTLSANTGTVYRLDLYSFATGGGNTSTASMLTFSVPEPNTLLLLLAGLLAAGLTRRRSLQSTSV